MTTVILAHTRDVYLEVKGGEVVSGLQAIKVNPAKPSATAMERLTKTNFTALYLVNHGPFFANRRKCIEPGSMAKMAEFLASQLQELLVASRNHKLPLTRL